MNDYRIKKSTENRGQAIIGALGVALMLGLVLTFQQIKTGMRLKNSIRAEERLVAHFTSEMAATIFAKKLLVGGSDANYGMSGLNPRPNYGVAPPLPPIVAIKSIFDTRHLTSTPLIPKYSAGNLSATSSTTADGKLKLCGSTTFPKSKFKTCAVNPTGNDIGYEYTVCGSRAIEATPAFSCNPNLTNFNTWEATRPVTLISTEDQLATVPLSNGHFRLANNIAITRSNWVPVSLSNSIFDGNGFAITNVRVISTAGVTLHKAGVFNRIYASRVKRLSIDGASIRPNDLDASHSGSLAAEVYDSEITDSRVLNSIVEPAYSNAGGDFGETGGLAGVFRCSIARAITIDNVSIRGSNAGGLSGSGFWAQVVDSTLTRINVNGDYVNSPTATTSYPNMGYIGGIFGKMVDHFVSGTTVNAQLFSTRTSGRCGGIIGEANHSARMVSSRFTGSIDCTTDAGGFYGLLWISPLPNSPLYRVIEKSSVNATIKGGITGGFVGWLLSPIVISESYVKGTVRGNGAIGGMIGDATLFGPQQPVFIENSYSHSDVSMLNMVTIGLGGLVGRIAGSALCTNQSYYAGSIASTELKASALMGTRIRTNQGHAQAFTKSTYFNRDLTGTLPGGRVWESSTNEISIDPNIKLGVTTAPMKEQITYSDWDFDNTWELPANSYPVLRNTP